MLDGVKSGVPRGHDAELFLVGAELDGQPQLFLVESSDRRPHRRERPVDGGPGRRHQPASVLDDVPVGSISPFGDEDTYRDAVRLARLGWCALAVGTAQAVLDYVIPYVNERQAFGEPISNRQSVAFMVANIAIELQGMRLVTYKAASRAAQGKTFDREVALARKLAPRRACRSGWTACSCSAATATSRSTRSSGGTATSGPSASWREGSWSDEKRASTLGGKTQTSTETREKIMINLETPKKHKAARRPGPPGRDEPAAADSRKYDKAEHEYPVELDMLAAMIDGLSESGASEGAGATGVRRSEDSGDKPS